MPFRSFYDGSFVFLILSEINCEEFHWCKKDHMVVIHINGESSGLTDVFKSDFRHAFNKSGANGCNDLNVRHFHVLLLSRDTYFEISSNPIND